MICNVLFWLDGPITAVLECCSNHYQASHVVSSVCVAVLCITPRCTSLFDLSACQSLHAGVTFWNSWEGWWLVMKEWEVKSVEKKMELKIG